VTAGARYPFPPYPSGWYLLLESAALAPGQVRPVRYFGRDLALFRTEAGAPVLLDAHCPHMGAHLGYGGTVEGDGLRCPFHHWRFDGDGRCDDVPYLRDGAVVPDAGVACWPVHETSGLLLTSFGSPAWSMPDLPEWHDGCTYEQFGWTVRMHVQELAENIPDTTHFLYVHHVPVLPVAEVETDGHLYHQRTIGRTDDGTIAWQTEQWAYGLGLVWLRTPGQVPFLTATTPIDDETVDLRLLFLVDDHLDDAGKAMIEAIAATTADDVPIWEHKVYRDRPHLVPGDGPIGVLRKWARQFYDRPSEVSPRSR